MSNNNNNNNREVARKDSSKRELSRQRDPFGFEEFFSGWPMKWDVGFGLDKGGEFVPRIDVHETKEAIVVDVELAGVPKENINVEHHDDILTVSGENKFEKKEDDPDKKWHRVERRYGSFRRQLQLPKGVQHDKITAASNNGILTITVPKPPEEAPATRKIKVN